MRTHHCWPRWPLGKDKFEAFTVCDYCWTEVRAEGSPEGGESSPELEALSFWNAHFDCADKISYKLIA